MDTKALINFSSHALSQKAKDSLSPHFDIIEEVFIHNINFNENVEEQLREIIRNVKTPLDGSIPITLIVPGQATIAVLLITFLSGIIGHIPDICLLEMDEDGFYVPTTSFILSGNNIKTSGRKFRQELWSSKK